MQDQSIDPKLLFVRFDASVAQTVALSLLSLARCDSFESFMAKPADPDETCEAAIARMFTGDDAGRRLLKANGSGYLGSAVALALLTLFEHIPEENRIIDPKSGQKLTAACMAYTVLTVTRHWLETAFGDPVEGPKRTPQP